MYKSNSLQFSLKDSGFIVPMLALVLFAFIPIDIQIYIILTLFCYFVLWGLSFEQSDKFKLIVFAGFTLRVVLIFVDEYLGSVLQEQSDQILYNLEANIILDNIKNNSPMFYNVFPGFGVKSYSFIMGMIYKVFGPVPILPRLLNIFLNVWSGILLYKISRELFEKSKIALLAMALFMFWPSNWAFTSYALRDSMIIFLSFLLITYFIDIVKNKPRFGNILMIVLIYTLSTLLRNQNSYLYIVMFLFYGIYLFFKSKVRKSYKLLLLFGILLLLLFVYLKFKLYIDLVLAYPFVAQPLRVEGGSAYLVNIEMNNYWDVFKYSPIRFFYFTFGPFLWNVRTIFQLFSALESVALFIVFWGFIQYFRKYKIPKNENLQMFIVIFCLVGLMANAIVDSNFGTAIRHRLNYTSFFFVFFSVYMQNFKIRWIS